MFLLSGSGGFTQGIDTWYEHNPGHPLHTDVHIYGVEDASGYSTLEIEFGQTESNDTLHISLERCGECARYESTYGTGNVLGSYKYVVEEGDNNVNSYLIMNSEATGEITFMLIEEVAEGFNFSTYVYQLTEKR